MRPSILSVNVARPRILGVHGGQTVVSGIAKTPIAAEAVRVGTINIEGDGQADLTAHGGEDKAVYAYPADHWPWWEKEHGLACAPATFGENLTLRGVDESAVAIGDRFAWGTAVLEVSQPRAPCYKFAMHTHREDAPQLMVLAARCGWYFRVVTPGEAPTRNSELLRLAKSGGPSVREAFIAALHPRVPSELSLRVRDAPALARAWRVAVARRIAKSRD